MKTAKFISILLGVIFIFSCEQDGLENSRITTTELSGIEASKAVCGGSINYKGILPVLSRGVCWSEQPDPTLDNDFTNDGKGIGAFESVITNLNARKQYFVRAYCTTANDTIYGNQLEFTTIDFIQFASDVSYGSVRDIDGNEYKTIQIGDQVWMAENLKTTRYQNGDPIEHLTDLNKWGHFQINYGAYIYYDNDTSNKAIHGALYNWYAASDSRNVAPEGWRVPSSADWQELIDYLDPYLNKKYGYKLRETTSAHWYFDTQMFYASTNSTGFTSIPSGKVVPGEFMDKGGAWAYYWTSTGTYDGSNCIYLLNDITIDQMQPNARGFSIRCIKN